MSHQALIRFYETLTPESVDRFVEFYTEDAYFKDPFNEVHDLAGIRRIFSHMFRQVADPRFRVIETVAGDNGTMLVWEFHYRPRTPCFSRDQVMRGVSHLRLAADGRVNYHRDYWDTGEELYAKLPGLNLLMRGLRRALAA